MDNNQVVSLGKTGHSENLELAHKAANVRACFLKDAANLGWLRIRKVASKLNKSNPLTKPVNAAEWKNEALFLNMHGSGSRRADLWRTQAR